MKAGIITITNGENYGNRLQNYAIQEFLKKQGIQSKTFLTNCYTKSFLKYFLKSKLKLLYNYFRRSNVSLRAINFYKFNKRISFSKNILNNDSFPKNIEFKYDFFIAGSDQIWNLNYPENNIIYFLGFIKNPTKKLSFSASFGSEKIPSNINSNIPLWLKDIPNISVREGHGVEIIKKLTGRTDVEVLIDPTMLLSSKEWSNISRKPSFHNDRKYILAYFLGKLSAERKRIIEDTASKNDCDIIYINDPKSKYYTCGPNEFLWLEKNAFLICTDSFHSCVFSIIFDRPFVIFDREEKGIISMNSRIDTLIKTFELKNRNFDGKGITKKNIEHNYSETYKILELEQKKCRDFLEKSINNI